MSAPTAPVDAAVTQLMRALPPLVNGSYPPPAAVRPIANEPAPPMLRLPLPCIFLTTSRSAAGLRVPVSMWPFEFKTANLSVPALVGSKALAVVRPGALGDARGTPHAGHKGRRRRAGLRSSGVGCRVVSPPPVVPTFVAFIVGAPNDVRPVWSGRHRCRSMRRRVMP